MEYNLRYKMVYGDLDRLIAKIAKALVIRNFGVKGVRYETVHIKGVRNFHKIICESEHVEITLSRADGVDMFGRPYAFGVQYIKIGDKKLYTPILPPINQPVLLVSGRRYIRSTREGSDYFVPDLSTGSTGTGSFEYKSTLREFVKALKCVLEIIEAS